ncbi:MAG: penicillin-binding protein 2 [Verrucomicrobiales bacterium]|nr:penicillin-binding protein 2 [Verrucomicrobiales bacterium]
MIFAYRLRLLLIGSVIIGGFSALLFRLWFLQIEKQEDYVKKLPGTRKVYHRITGARGRILDCNGVELARNKTTLQVGLDLGAIVQYYRDTHKGTVPMYEWDPRKDKEPDIAKIVQEIVIEPLRNLDLAKSYNEEHLRRHYRTNKGEIPYVYDEDVSWERFAQFAEHNHNLPGVTISQRFLREYPFGAMAGHLMGYVKLFSPDDMPEEDKKKGYKFYEGDDKGVQALEKTLDAHLRGKPGFRTLLINEHGRLERELAEEFQPPHRGDDVYLTIDARLQYIAEMALREGGVGRGAIVIMEPNTGEVKAMAAVPSYDPNRFIPAINKPDFAHYNEDETAPLLNRAIQGFAPGSTFKVLVALAGFFNPGHMRNGYNCDNYVTYGNRPFPCWTVQKSMGGHGWLDLSGGIKNSCNCFFYQYGNDAGIDNIIKIGKMIGLGIPTGIELEGESPGLIPGPNYYQINSLGRWGSAQTANVSIGQGEVLASPLQMACVAATVANGKTAFIPTLVHHRVDYQKATTKFIPKVRTDLTKEGIKSAQLEMVRKGMWRVVNEPGGTGKNFKSDIEAIAKQGGGAGKTGTAQNKRGKGIKDNHTWFICFAPYDRPKYAICVLVQNGHAGGATAAPVARRVMEQAISVETGGYRVDPNAIGRMPEATGHFNFIESPKFPGVNLPETPTDEDTGDGGSDSEPLPVKVKSVPFAQPDFKAEGNVVVPKAKVVDKPRYQTNPQSKNR